MDSMEKFHSLHSKIMSKFFTLRQTVWTDISSTISEVKQSFEDLHKGITRTGSSSTSICKSCSKRVNSDNWSGSPVKRPAFLRPSICMPYQQQSAAGQKRGLPETSFSEFSETSSLQTQNRRPSQKRQRTTTHLMHFSSRVGRKGSSIDQGHRSSALVVTGNNKRRRATSTNLADPHSSSPDCPANSGVMLSPPSLAINVDFDASLAIRQAVNQRDLADQNVDSLASSPTIVMDSTTSSSSGRGDSGSADIESVADKNNSVKVSRSKSSGHHHQRRRHRHNHRPTCRHFYRHGPQPIVSLDRLGDGDTVNLLSAPQPTKKQSPDDFLISARSVAPDAATGEAEEDLSSIAGIDSIVDDSQLSSFITVDVGVCGSDPALTVGGSPTTTNQDALLFKRPLDQPLVGGSRRPVTRVQLDNDKVNAPQIGDEPGKEQNETFVLATTTITAAAEAVDNAAVANKENNRPPTISPHNSGVVKSAPSAAKGRNAAVSRNPPACQDCREYLADFDGPIQQIDQPTRHCLRHRRRQSVQPPPSTPKGFWDIGIPDSEQDHDGDDKTGEIEKNQTTRAKPSFGGFRRRKPLKFPAGTKA